MLNRRQFLNNSFGMSALALFPLLASCRSNSQISVAIHTWIGYESIFLAEQFGWLDQAITLKQNQNATESLEMLIKGEVQVACLTLDEALLAVDAGVNAKVALIFNVSAGADMVIARQALTTLSDLKGLRVGYEPGALGALMLSNLLRQADLDQGDVVLIDLPPDRQLEAWNQKKVDVVITYELVAGLLLSLGGHKLFDSRSMPESIFDVLVVRPDILDRQQNNLVENLVTAHFKGLEYLFNYRQDALYRIVTRQKTSLNQVQTSLAGVHLPTLYSNHRYLSGQDKRLKTAVNEIKQLMIDSSLLTQSIDLEQLFDARWLPAMKE